MLDKRALLAAAFFPALARAVNDWSVPCTDGTCSYDSGDGVNSAWASINLNGDASALSDLTTVAGWTVADCSATWSSGQHTVQATCTGAEDQCSHLTDGGAEGKVVRLPKDCGTGPFAVVASTPAVTKRDDGKTAHTLVLDYNFANGDPTKGNVAFTITSSSVKGGPAGLERRTFLRGAASTIVARFDKNETINAPPIHVEKDLPLFTQSLSCGPATINVNADVDVVLDANANIGVHVTGGLLPPKISTLAITGHIDGSATATFNVDASATGTFDSGSIQLFTIGIPGFDLPGIFSVGPTFNINAQVVATLGAEAKLTAAAVYNFPSVDLVFPQDQGQSAADITPAQAPFDVSVNPTVTASGSVTGKIIPQIALGLSALGGLFDADLHLDLALSATAGVQATANLNPPTAPDGCATLDIGVDVSAGATGKIEPIFDKDINFDIFQKDFNLVKKCFGANPPAKRSFRMPAAAAYAQHKRDLSCGLGGADLEQVVAE